ncbi:hypothetical protein [Glycomyces sambucus]|uniref:hypothetical protein n=1 Tax=Glycomyces sambucus TaxID=380244 RepID=UPI00115FC5BF|nr:hypothetical protein [Glycomyces sambucus]
MPKDKLRIRVTGERRAEIDTDALAALLLRVARRKLREESDAQNRNVAGTPDLLEVDEWKPESPGI